MGKRPSNENYKVKVGLSTLISLGLYAKALNEHIDQLEMKEYPQKPKLDNGFWRCSNCGAIQTYNFDDLCIECQNSYCGKCGYKVGWEKINDK